MAKLNYKYATMNSGKTLDLIRTAHNYEENGFKVLVLKPLIDTKGNKCITSRIGASREVDFLIDQDEKIVEILKGNLNEVKCIFVDEAQFLSRRQIDELFLISHMTDVEVICYGLRTNFKMESFAGSKKLLEIADVLEELTTLCKCGRIARYVGRKVGDAFVQEGEEIIIDGTSDIEYVPLCGRCYLSKVEKLNLQTIKENFTKEETNC